MGHDMWYCKKCGRYNFYTNEDDKCVCEIPTRYVLDILKVKDNDVLTLVNGMKIQVKERLYSIPALYVLSPKVNYTCITEYDIAKKPEYKVITINDNLVDYDQEEVWWRVR